MKWRVAALLTLLVVGLGVIVASRPPAVALTTSTVTNEQRLQSATFRVLLPAVVPPGTTLMRTTVQQNSDGTSNVDVEYRMADGGRLHVWETNRGGQTLGGKDPTQEIGPTRAGRLAVWREGTGFSGGVTTLSAQVGPLIISIDGPLSAAQLLEIADSLR